MGLFTRSIRPPDDITPNPNDPGSVPPATVGPNQLVVPGDPDGFVVAATVPETTSPPPRIIPSAWSGWPADWWPPFWGNNHRTALNDTAWTCVDLNSQVLSSMPPYLVGAAPTLNADWLNNPDGNVYTAWPEFSKNLFWDYQLGEAFVRATSYYSTGWPAAFHVVPPWLVNVEFGGDGVRRYSVGEVDITPDVLHIRYQGSVDDAHGHGPLEAGRYRMVAADTLIRYSSGLAASGGIPASVLKWPHYELSPEQAQVMKNDWVQARVSSLGEPAVLSGGTEWEATQMSPEDMAMTDLLHDHQRAICALMGVPHFLVGVPSGGDSLTYSTAAMMLDFHWRAYLRPKAQMVMSALSEWLLPRGTRVELNRDEYIQPGPLERAQTAAILHGIVDADGNPVLSVNQIQQAERLTNSQPTDLASGVLR